MRFISSLLTTVALLLLSLPAAAQTPEFSDLDKSPMDAAHYPFRSRYLNYLDDDSPDRNRRIKVLYSRPRKNGRELFGGIIPWGTDWRLGANEATEVTFYQNVQIGGTMVPAGTYTMFAQVYPDHWIIKISTERFIGGSQDRDMSQDIAAVSVPTKMVRDAREYFTVGYQKVDDAHVDMLFEWGNTRATLPISFNAVVLEQENVSPLDLVQYPPMSRLRNFVKEEDLEANEPKVRVVYGRPQLKGRKVFGELLPYGKLWRLGANETTEVTFFDDVTIGGKPVKAGRYGLFATPKNGEWEFVLHSSTQSWGSANYDEADTVLKMTAGTEKTPETLEALSMTFVEAGDDTVHLVIGWEDTMARLPIVLR